MAKLQKNMEDITARLSAIEVVGESGGGMVKVIATGAQRIKSVKIEKALFDAGDVEMLEDLLLAGLNQALQAASERAGTETREALGNLMPPGLSLDRFTG